MQLEDKRVRFGVLEYIAFAITLFSKKKPDYVVSEDLRNLRKHV